MTKILICGGHLSPALGVIEKLKEKKDYEIYYVGRKKALEGDDAESLEFKTINKLKIPFYNLICARLQRSFTLHTIPSFLKFPFGFIQSMIMLVLIRPKIVVSFGGYVALPVSINAKILSIPVITHEQTAVLGIANRIIAKISKVLCLSYENTLNIPSGVTTVFTGNPIRRSLTTRNKNITEFGDAKLPLIYITGGSLGSRSINKTVAKIIPQLVGKYRIFHQCGSSDGGADYEEMLRIKNNLPQNIRDNYLAVKYVEPQLVGEIFNRAKLLIGRAGANTVNEILYFKVPSILIPLPWAGQNEQVINADYVEEAGLGIVISQKSLTPEKLLQTVGKMLDKKDSYQNHSQKSTKILSTAADIILQLIEKFV